MSPQVSRIREPKPEGAQLARRMSRMKASAVREILKVTERPDIISFAGGLPAAELFPVQAFAQAHADVLAREGPAALQYSTTEGWAPLREWILKRLELRGIRASLDEIVITAGSQQGIDLTGKILLDPGDEVVVEDPTYLAALQSFGGHEARAVAVKSDGEGMDMDDLARVLARRRPKLIYLVPDFANPKGTTLPLERRKRLVALAQRHGVPVLEDDPYSSLRFRGAPLPAVHSLDDSGLVLHLGTFSKTLAPGVRVGWVVGSKALVRQLAVAKQAADLHPSTLSQRVVARLLETFDFDGHLRSINKVYGERRDAMLSALERHFPAGAKWTEPEGGLFVWVELPFGVTAEALLEDALKDKVAFVPGAPFFAAGDKHGFCRLNFSNRSPEVIEKGIKAVGDALRRRIAAA